MSLDLSILIVSYNTEAQTLDCIRSIIEQTHSVSYEIIVIDNASRDGSAAAIAAAFPQITLIASKENFGFAGANNRVALLAKGKRLLLLNPDTLIQNHAIDELMRFADKTPESLIWGGKTTFPDGNINPSCLGDITLWSIICRACGLTYLFPRVKFCNPEYVHMWDRLDKEREVDIVVGCFLLVDHALWKTLGGFNPDFFMYGEEVDLALRARKLGARPRMTPQATIIHYGGASEPSSEDKAIKIFKGRITVMKVHWSALFYLIGRFILLATVSVRAAVSFVKRPPTRRGAGMDERADMWIGIFKRRHEWINGWPTGTR